jgi:hypothetical protein
MRLGRVTILRRVKRALLLTLVVALALAASSCGGGGGGQLSKSEFEAKIGAILQPLQGSTLQDLVRISAGDRAGAIQALKEGESKLHEAASELGSMKPPDDAVEPTRLLAKGVGEIADQVTAVRKDAEHGDFGRLVQFKVTLASDPAVSEIRDAAVQLINLGYNVTGGEGP